MTRLVRDIQNTAIEGCAKAVEDIPASASLYEDRRIADAVIAFKKQAISEIRSLLKTSHQ